MTSTHRVGSVLGFITNLYQERVYQYVILRITMSLSVCADLNACSLSYRRYFPTKGPEARLFGACFAAVLLPVGMFIYAWSSFRSVPWIAQAIGITIFIWGVFIIYLAVFSYLADWYAHCLICCVFSLTATSSYGPFASSALAGQSLARE
jgi:hypothetical protein